MFLELIAAVSAAVAAAGLALLVNKLTGGRLPKWAMPMAAAVAMLSFAIVMEYSWFERTTADFPEGVEVTTVHEARGFWRPWTYVYPLVDRFVAVERASIRTNDSVPDQRLVDLLFFGRWQPLRTVPMVFDCGAARGAPLLDDVTFDATGAVLNANWAPVPSDDPILMTVCKES